MEFELSRPIIVDDLPNHGQTVNLNSTEDERLAVAKRLDVVSIAQLEGQISIRPEIGREIVAEGEVNVLFVQNCVITGDPIEQSMTFPLSRRFSEEASEFDDLDGDEDTSTDPMDDGPDPIENGIIDVGEAVVEELALQIPPYPRSQGAEFTDILIEEEGDSLRDNPFAKLASLKNVLKT